MGFLSDAKKLFTSTPDASPPLTAKVDPDAANLADRKAVLAELEDGAARAREELAALEAAHAKALDSTAKTLAPTASLVAEARNGAATARTAYLADASDKNAKDVDSAERTLRFAALRHDDVSQQAKAVEDASAANVNSARERVVECERQVALAKDGIAAVEREIADAKERHRASREGLHERADVHALAFLESLTQMRTAWTSLLAEYKTTSTKVARYHLVIPILEALADKNIACDVDVMNHALSPAQVGEHPDLALVRVVAELIHRTHTNNKLGGLPSHLDAYKGRLARLRRTNDPDEAQLEEWRELADAEHDPLNQRGEALRRLGRHVEASNVQRGDQ